MQLHQFQGSPAGGLHRVSRLWRDLAGLAGSRTGAGAAPLKRKELQKEAANASAAALDVDTEELKAQLLDSLFGIERGLSASGEVRAEVSELVSQLEARSPVPSPNEELGRLDGAWRLVYTASSELVPLLALGRLPLVTVGDVIQRIDAASLAVENKVFLRGPFSQTSFSTTATLEIASPKRLQVAFQQGRIATPQLLQDLEFPDSISVLGQPVDLTNLKDALRPVNARVKEAALQLSEISRQLPDLSFPINGRQAQSWLINTYLDSDLRISRGDGGSIFVLVKAE